MAEPLVSSSARTTLVVAFGTRGDVQPLLTLLSSLALAQTDPSEERLRPANGSDLTEAFQVDEGLEVTLWAQSPQLYNPTAIPS